jgi:hypothetical protein
MRATSFALACAGVATTATIAGLALTTQQTQAAMPPGAKLPTFVVDGTWPKPFPSTPDPVTGRARTWITGEVAGTCVDSRDHVFIVTRGNLLDNEVTKGTPAPPVMEFDPDGNVVAGWGVRTQLPTSIHGCFVDYQDNIWIGGNGDGVIQKYSRAGTFLMQIGTKGVCDNPPDNKCGDSSGNPAANQSHTLLNEPADIYVDPNPDPQTGQRGSIYVADGYGNHRVVVFKADGTYLRQWGGVAGTVTNPLTDSQGLFGPGGGGHPHCVVIAQDKMVYVCDRPNDRIQVFDRMGALQKIIPVVPGTGPTTTGPGGQPGLNIIGSAWDLDFSADFRQAFIFEADGGNEIMHVMDRTTGSILANFGQPGAQAGQFTYLHTIARDSKGNLYTGETINGRRIQKLKPVSNDDRQ